MRSSSLISSVRGRCLLSVLTLLPLLLLLSPLLTRPCSHAPIAINYSNLQFKFNSFFRKSIAPMSPKASYRMGEGPHTGQQSRADFTPHLIQSDHTFRSAEIPERYQSWYDKRDGR